MNDDALTAPLLNEHHSDDWWRFLFSKRIALFAILWAAGMAVSATLGLLLHGWESGPRLLTVALLFLLGGLVGGYCAWILADMASAKSSPSQRFSVMFLLLGLLTGLFTATLFVLQYRQHFAPTHMPPLTIGWMFQFAFTGVAALYMFAVQGARLFMPLGVIGLFCAAFYFANRPR